MAPTRSWLIPSACIPQAWAAARPFMLLQALLGISAHAPDNGLTVDRPVLPEWLGSVEVCDVRIARRVREPVVPAHGSRRDRVLAAQAGRRRASHDVGMTSARPAAAAAPPSAALERRFEAIVLDWDGPAAADGRSRRGTRPRTRRGRLRDGARDRAGQCDARRRDGRAAGRPPCRSGQSVAAARRRLRGVSRRSRGHPSGARRTGPTDEADSVGWILRELWRRGIAPGQVLVARDVPGRPVPGRGAGGPAREPDRAPATGRAADRRRRRELDAADRRRRPAARARA